MKRQRVLAGLALAAAATLAVGCTSGAGGGKAGGSEEPVVLGMSIGYGTLSYLPAAAYFAERVGQLSGGALKIEVALGKNTEPGFEQQIVRDVEAGRTDLAWVGTRVFDTFGVKSFQALTAPMLVESYPLLQAVLDSDISAQMLKSLDGLGLNGLAVAADSLRRPLAVDRPLLGPADWQGITFAVIRSDEQAEAIRALGATPIDVWGTPSLDDGLASGQIQGVEKGLLAVQIYDSLVHEAPYITANVILWPQSLALVANPDRLSRLTNDQRGWLDGAAHDAASRSTGLVQDEGEDQIAANLCTGGARFAEASQVDLAGLRRAFAPVYSELEQDPQTKTFIDRIEQLKASRPPGPALSIPPGCTGPAPHGAAADPIAGKWQTQKLTESQIVQAFVEAGGSEREIREGLSQAGISYVVITLQFEDGQFTEFESDDGGIPEEGYNARYEITNDTLTLSGCGTYRFVVTGETLRLFVIDQCTNGDGPYNTTLFATFPMTRTG